MVLCPLFGAFRRLRRKDINVTIFKQSIASNTLMRNLSYLKPEFWVFSLENSHLTIPFEQMYEICLETLPIFVAREPKTQV